MADRKNSVAPLASVRLSTVFKRHRRAQRGIKEAELAEMDLLTREARKMTMRTVQPKTSLVDLPNEILLQIVGYVMNDFSPNGHLSKLSPAAQTVGVDDPTREAILGSEVVKVAKLRDSIANLLRRVRLMSASSHLSIIMVNKRLHGAGIDFLYSTNTITLTSRETRDLMQHPGLVALLRNLRIHERNPLECVLTTNGKGPSEEAFLRTLLEAPRLHTLHIDIEPFFVKESTTFPEYVFNQHGLQACLKTFNLHTCAVPRTTDVATYALHPLPSLLNPHIFEPRHDHPWLTPRLLAKLTLHLPTISTTWHAVSALPLQDLLALAWRRNYPHDPLSPNWWRPTTSRKKPRHTLYDWMICLRNDILLIQPQLSKATVHVLALMPLANGEFVEVPGDFKGKGKLGDHFWTVVFGSESVRARNAVLEGERRRVERVRRRWMMGTGFGLSGGDGRGVGERFRLVGM